MAKLEEALAAERAHTEEQGQLVRPPSPHDPACKQLPARRLSSPPGSCCFRALLSTSLTALHGRTQRLPAGKAPSSSQGWLLRR